MRPRSLYVNLVCLVVLKVMIWLHVGASGGTRANLLARVALWTLAPLLVPAMAYHRLRDLL